MLAYEVSRIINATGLLMADSINYHKWQSYTHKQFTHSSTTRGESNVYLISRHRQHVIAKQQTLLQYDQNLFVQGFYFRLMRSGEYIFTMQQSLTSIASNSLSPPCSPGCQCLQSQFSWYLHALERKADWLRTRPRRVSL
jgi:hypothetical protein